MRPGPDAAEASKENDHLQRWRFARGLYELIRTSPPEWSLRLGVYGRWGEGKTTILQFIETMAKADDQSVIRFNPWAIGNPEDMWDTFAAAVIKGLAKSPLRDGA